MSQHVTMIQIRKGLNADRINMTPYEGELLYITDTKQLCIGDGITPGGKVVGFIDEPGDIGEYFAGVGLNLAGSVFSVEFGQEENTVCSGDDNRIPSIEEKEALQGSYGDPSNTNRFLTQEDPIITGPREPNQHDINSNTYHSGVLSLTLGGIGHDVIGQNEILVGAVGNVFAKKSIVGTSGVNVDFSGENIIIDGSSISAPNYSAGTGLSLVGTEFSVDYGTTVDTACRGNDSRLTDSRDPNVHEINTHTGILNQSHGGTGINTYLSGQLLIGNNSGGLTASVLTAGDNIEIINGNGSIIINAVGDEISYMAGTGLTLTGTTFAVDYGTTNTTVCRGDDARLSDARTPTSHNLDSHTGTLAINKGGTGQSTYMPGQLLIGNNSNGLTPNTLIGMGGITISNGDGVITIDGTSVGGDEYFAGTGLTLTGTTFAVDYGTTNTTACRGDDARLSDARTPTSHNLDTHTGTLSVNKGGTGQTTYTAGQLLIGNSTGGLTPNTLSGAGGIVINSGNGVITIDGTSVGGDEYFAGTGLTLTGTTFAIDYGTTDITACRGDDSRLHVHTETGLLSNGFGQRFISTVAPEPTDGVNGDIWLQHD